MSTHAQPEPTAEADFVSTDELVRRQGIRPVRSIEDLQGDDPFSSDEEYEAFLTDLYSSRRADS